MNTTHISGNLTADVEVLHFNDKALIKFTIGCNQGDRALFMPVEVWNQEHLKDFVGKGSRVLVTGHLKQDSWQNKAGERRSRIVLVGSHVEFLDFRRGEQEGPGRPVTLREDSPNREEVPVA